MIRRPWVFGFSAASVLTFPYWMGIFQRRGTPFDNNFVSNHHLIPVQHYLDYVSGALVFFFIAGVLGALVAFALSRSELWAKRFESAIAVSLILFVLNAVRTHFLTWMSYDYLRSFAVENPLTSGGAVIATILLGGWLLRFTAKYLINLVLIGAPIGAVVLVNVSTAAFTLKQNAFIYKPEPLARHLHSPVSPVRLIWMIFDEMDYRLVFEKRPKNLQLKNLDNLLKEAFTATRAYPPANYTGGTLPILTSGSLSTRQLSSVKEWGKLFHPPDSLKNVIWTRVPTIFSMARSRGLNVSVFGQAWIPYCRMFHEFLTNCWEMGKRWHRNTLTVIKHVTEVLRDLLSYVPGINRWVRPEQSDSSILYVQFLQGVQRAVADRSVALSYVHWNIPHTPYVYDASVGQFIRATDDPLRYFDALALADRMFGEIRSTMESSGVWDRTAVLVTSDHHWRSGPKNHDGVTDYRVPFILRLPGSPGKYVSSSCFNTIVATPMVMAVLEGSINSPHDVETFIRHSDIAKEGSARKYCDEYQ